MINVIPKWGRDIWDEWNLRGSIIFSLLLQILLILFSPLRKRTNNTVITAIIWSAYLLADWVAAFAVGLIANSQTNMRAKCQKAVQTESLLAFWAPFLLLHLGGPDAISAFSLEDNELWIRHLFGLVVQFIAVSYVILQALPDELWIPTLLMLLAGTIKYAERTRALYLACLGNFKATMLPRPDAGPNYAQFMEEYSSKKIAHVPVEIRIEKEFGEGAFADDKALGPPLSDLAVVEKGFNYFETFKGLIVDLMFTFQERKDSRKFLFERSPEDAFRVMEVELNFMYDSLYTKMVVVNTKIGYVLRFLCTACIVASLERFASLHKQKNHGNQVDHVVKMHHFDVYATYALLIGAIGLDLIALVKLIFSDWTIVRLNYHEARQILLDVRKKLFRIIEWLYTLDARWSNTLSQHNLIFYCLKERFTFIDTIVDWFGVKETLDELEYVHKVCVPDDLKKFIFEEIKRKARIASDSKAAREICSGRGDWVLSQTVCPSLVEHVDVEYDESLLRWHIATELCYYEMEDPQSSHGVSSDKELKAKSEFCKLLSDYMLYLLVMRPTMMSAVAGIGQIRFRDTCAEAKKFFLRKDIIPPGQFRKWFPSTWFRRFLGSKDVIPSGQVRKWDPENWFRRFLCCGSSEGNSGGQSQPSFCMAWFKKFFPAKQEAKSVEQSRLKSPSPKMKEAIRNACEELLLIETVVKPIEVKGDRSKSVLFDACILAKELKKLDERKMWKIMSEIWVEILAYAAGHCGPKTHAQQLSKGGELITFVWLLMIQFGLGDQFRVEAGHARAKLLVDK